MANFNMPDFDLGFRAYAFIYNCMHDHPEAFYENTNIASIFGCFGGAIWNGGGTLIGGSTNRQYMEDLRHFYNDVAHIPMRLTFTNPLITQNQCYDTYCNVIAEVLHNGKNEILTSSPVLEDYLRKNYPNYKYCRSIIATKDEPYSQDPKYNLVVMKRRMNNNWDYLDTVPMEHRGKIEFLCCDPCPDDCPRIYTHYRDFARAQLTLDTTASECQCSMNHIKGPFQSLYTKHLETYISRDMIDNLYIPKGFNQFKISGRANVSSIIFGIINYLVKPEYHEDILIQLYDLYLGG